jgi:hypothetical protein
MNEFHNEGFVNNVNLGNKNLFTNEKLFPNVFVPNQLQLESSSSDSNDNKVYDFSCKDNNINGINHFILEIGLKELRGKGAVAYQKNLAYQLINNFKIRSINNKKNDCYLINQREIFNNVKSLGNDTFHKWSVQAGTNKDLCNFTYSDDERNLLKPSFKIYAKIRLPFDNAVTEVLKFPKGSELLFTVSLKSLNDAMCYTSSYMTNLTPKDMYESVNLYAYTYNIMIGDVIPLYYIEHEESLLIKPGTLKNIINDQQGRVFEETKNITKNVTSVKVIVDSMLSGKRFLSHPGYKQTETNWKLEYHNKLIKELILELDEDESLEDYIKEHYKTKPSNVDNYNFNNPILIPIDNVKNIKIVIHNIPRGKKLYYHSNILGYNYIYNNPVTKLKETCVTNISDKFISIIGEYHNKEIKFNEITSTIDILDISTPFEVWNSPNAFNNRTKLSELDYVIINDNFLSGLDFLGKYQPLENLSFYVDTDSSTCKEKRSLTGFKSAKIFLLNSINTCDKYPQEYNYRYSHNLLMVKPNTFKINKTISTSMTFIDYKNQVNEYDLNFILKIFSLKDLKVRDNVVLSEYI